MSYLCCIVHALCHTLCDSSGDFKQQRTLVYTYNIHAVQCLLSPQEMLSTKLAAVETTLRYLLDNRKDREIIPHWAVFWTSGSGLQVCHYADWIWLSQGDGNWIGSYPSVGKGYKISACNCNALSVNCDQDWKVSATVQLFFIAI